MVCSKFVPRVFCGENDAAACPVCGGYLVQIKQKFICARCHRIVEGCCE